MNNSVLEETISRIEKLVNSLLSENQRLTKLLMDREAEIDALLNNERAPMLYSEFEQKAMLALNSKAWQVPFAKQTGINRFAFQKYQKIGVVPSDVVAMLDTIVPHDPKPKMKWTPESKSFLIKRYPETEGIPYNKRIDMICAEMKEKFGHEVASTAVQSVVSRMVKEGKLPRKSGRQPKTINSGSTASASAAAFAMA